MKSSRKLLVPLATAGVLIGGLGAALASPADASPSDGGSGGGSGGMPGLTVTASPAATPSTSTKVVVSAVMAHRLHRTGISLVTVGGASKSTNSQGRIVIGLPTTGTHATEPAFTHRGGVVFRDGKRHLRIDRARLNFRDQVLSARVDRAGRADVFRVSAGSSARDVRRITLTKTTARLLDSQFHTRRFRPGQLFGTVQLPKLLGGYAVTESVDIINNTRYTLNYVGVDTNGEGHLTSTPKAQLAPSETALDPTDAEDTIDYASNDSHGGQMTITYRIDGTELTVQALFQVPTFGFNVAACNQGSFIDFNTCKIGSGYYPEGTWDLKTNTAKGPFPDLAYDTGRWRFHKIGAPGSKGLQVNNASTADGATVSISDNTTQNQFSWEWRPVVGIPGWGELINEGTGKCLEQNGSTGGVDQWTCIPGSPNELWRSVWNSWGGSALQLKSTGQYLGTWDPGSITDGTIPLMQPDLDQYTSWGADNVG